MYFHTKNGIVNIGKGVLDSNNLYSPSNVVIGARDNYSLLTCNCNNLLKTSYSDYKKIPTTSITVTTEPTWDYIPNYRQNNLDVKRFTYLKPSQKTISLQGNYVAPSTSNAMANSELDIFYMFNSFANDFTGMAVNPSSFSFQYLDTIHNQYLNLGKGMLPQSFNIRISGINEVQDVSWTAKFIGPCDKADAAAASNSPASSTTYGLRNLNTRDFLIQSGDINNFALIDLDMSLDIEWEKKATYLSYADSGATTPNWRWWGMNNMIGQCTVKLLVPAGYTKNYTNPWLVDGNLWDNPSICILIDSSPKLTLQKFYWQAPTVEFQSENISIVSFKGVLHGGEVIR